MPTNYLDQFPKPLLEDLVSARWLPVVGAGMSRNAAVPEGSRMPLWSDLGRELSRSLQDYEPASPTDAISEFDHQFGRARLTEKLAELLLTGKAYPGAAHEAFCKIQFDLVCTTNFDFLIEKQYERLQRTCTPLIGEDQLAVAMPRAGTTLLKLHGDTNHPERMIATETDYDQFLAKFPLLATYFANLLITRTCVLIGYSFDDPDLRQLWQTVRQRLGRHHRPAYAITVGASVGEVNRFARRGVTCINLPGPRSRQGEVLAAAFSQLSEYWPTQLARQTQIKEEGALREFALPAGSPSRLCLVLAPPQATSFYRRWVFPTVEAHSFAPVTPDDMATPQGAYLAKIDALTARSSILIIEPPTEYAGSDLVSAILRTRRDREQVLIVREANAEGQPQPYISLTDVVTRPPLTAPDPEEFVRAVGEWLERAQQALHPALEEEPGRLLGAREYRAAVISAISLLENWLRNQLSERQPGAPRSARLGDALTGAVRLGIISPEIQERAAFWIRTRNGIAHNKDAVTPRKAREIVSGVREITRGPSRR